ncbi:MAG: alanine racemase [Nonlabens sp.]
MLGTRLEIDLAALEHNYHYLRSTVKERVLFMAVVKANAYGHGMVQVAQKLEMLGANYMAVAYVSEGITLREAGIKLPILILHPQRENLEKCVSHCLEPVLYSREMMEAFYALAQAEQLQAYPVHLEVNTGLNRIGIDWQEWEAIKPLIDQVQHVEVRGFQSHLAASEDLGEQAFTLRQLQAFHKAAAQLENYLGRQVIKHTTNTSGILNYESAHYDMVRSGIGLYGYSNNPTLHKQLIPVARLVSKISQLRIIHQGETVSYNREFTARQDTHIAVVAIGHGDGIDRRHGNGRLEVIVHGQLAPTLGVICMDMFMVDVTHIDQVQVGDDVVIFDRKHPANLIASNAGTISYEVLTGIRGRVPRVYHNG